jgi:hypothetical protein
MAQGAMEVKGFLEFETVNSLAEKSRVDSQGNDSGKRGRCLEADLAKMVASRGALEGQAAVRAAGRRKRRDFGKAFATQAGKGGLEKTVPADWTKRRKENTGKAEEFFF